MLYRPSSFRKSALALTTVAALAGVSVLSSFPANAQQVVNASTCDGSKNSAAAIKCEFNQSVARTNAANAQTQAEAALKKCLVQITDFKKAQPAEFEKLGTITRENACEKAAKLPRVSASLN